MFTNKGQKRHEIARLNSSATLLLRVVHFFTVLLHEFAMLFELLLIQLQIVLEFVCPEMLYCETRH